MNQQNLGSKRPAAASPGNTTSRGDVGARSHQAAEHVKDAVVGRAQQARDRVHTTKDQTTGRIRSVATQLRQMSDTLREDDQLAADLAERASRGVDSIAEYVASATPQSFVRDTERLARRQPAVFYGAAFVLGLAAGRFIKSARPEGHRSSEDGQHPEPWQERTRTDRSSGFYPSSSSQRPSYADPDRSRSNADGAFGRNVSTPERRSTAEQRTASEAAATTTGTGVSMPAMDTRPRTEGGDDTEKGARS